MASACWLATTVTNKGIIFLSNSVRTKQFPVGFSNGGFVSKTRTHLNGKRYPRFKSLPTSFTVTMFEPSDDRNSGVIHNVSAPCPGEIPLAISHGISAHEDDHGPISFRFAPRLKTSAEPHPLQLKPQPRLEQSPDHCWAHTPNSYCGAIVVIPRSTSKQQRPSE